MSQSRSRPTMTSRPTGKVYIADPSQTVSGGAPTPLATASFAVLPSSAACGCDLSVPSNALYTPGPCGRRIRPDESPSGRISPLPPKKIGADHISAPGSGRLRAQSRGRAVTRSKLNLNLTSGGCGVDD